MDTFASRKNANPCRLTASSRHGWDVANGFSSEKYIRETLCKTVPTHGTEKMPIWLKFGQVVAIGSRITLAKLFGPYSLGLRMVASWKIRVFRGIFDLMLNNGSCELGKMFSKINFRFLAQWSYSRDKKLNDEENRKFISPSFVRPDNSSPESERAPQIW